MLPFTPSSISERQFNNFTSVLFCVNRVEHRNVDNVIVSRSIDSLLDDCSCAAVETDAIELISFILELLVYVVDGALREPVMLFRLWSEGEL